MMVAFLVGLETARFIRASYGVNAPIGGTHGLPTTSEWHVGVIMGRVATSLSDDPSGSEPRSFGHPGQGQSRHLGGVKAGNGQEGQIGAAKRTIGCDSTNGYQKSRGSSNLHDTRPWWLQVKQ